MRRVRSFNTKWEVDFRLSLWRLGLRYRIHYGRYRIDIAFPRQRVAIFLDSCFWHFCPRHRELPKTRRGYWKRKLERNRRRDQETTRVLEADGWRVIRIWSHDFLPRRVETANTVLREVHGRLKGARE